METKCGIILKTFFDLISLIFEKNTISLIFHD